MNPGPIKNPSRVPMSLQRASTPTELIGTAGRLNETVKERGTMASGEFKFNSQTGNYEATRDGVYERQAEAPADRIRVQMRKGHAVTQADAKLFSRVGPWPGEPSEEDAEATATAGAKQAAPPENKVLAPPENKAG